MRASAGSVGAIDRCPNLEALAQVGKRLYPLELSAEQAGVAWTHYRLRKAALEQAVKLGRPARGLLTQVERAPKQALPRLGSRLYRLQHIGGVTLSATEWRRIWSAYRTRRDAVGA